MNVEKYLHLIDKQVQFREKLEVRCCRKFVKPSDEFDIYLLLECNGVFFEKTNFNEKCFII